MKLFGYQYINKIIHWSKVSFVIRGVAPAGAASADDPAARTGHERNQMPFAIVTTPSIIKPVTRRALFN